MIQLSKLDYRIPNWDAKSLIDRVCPICNKKGESVFMTHDNFIVNKCSCCGTYFVSPAPEIESLNRFYSTYFKNHSSIPKLTSEQLKQNYNMIIHLTLLIMYCLLTNDRSFMPNAKLRTTTN